MSITKPQLHGIILALSAEIGWLGRNIERHEDGDTWATIPRYVTAWSIRGAWVGGRGGTSTSMSTRVGRRLRELGLIRTASSRTVVLTEQGHEQTIGYMRRLGFDGLAWCLDRSASDKVPDTQARRLVSLGIGKIFYDCGDGTKLVAMTELGRAVGDLVRNIKAYAPKIEAHPAGWWDRAA